MADELETQSQPFACLFYGDKKEVDVCILGDNLKLILCDVEYCEMINYSQVDAWFLSFLGRDGKLICFVCELSMETKADIWCTYPEVAAAVWYARNLMLNFKVRWMQFLLNAAMLCNFF